jgi:hypothetical protein
MLKAEVEEGDLESLGALKEHYAKGADGKYRPQGEDGAALVNQGKLLSALEAERTAHRKANEKLAKFAGISDPDAAADALAKVKDMANWTPEDKVRAQIESVKAQMSTAHAADKTALEAEKARLTKYLQQHVVENSARAALASFGVKDDLLLPHILPGLKMIDDGAGRIVARVVDSAGNEIVSRVKTDGSPMDVAEYVGTFRDKYAGAFPAPAAQGGGAGNAGAGAGGSASVLKIKASDHRAKSTHMARIADGTAIVVPD